jgi:hypothetical protein
MKFLRPITFLILVAQIFLQAQTPPDISPGAAVQMIMQPQPVAENLPTEITATAEFDPPTVGLGGKTFYRVTVGASQNSVHWPETISAPPELQFGASARGQLTLPDGLKAQPRTVFVSEITPTTAGHFTVPEFLVDAGWLPVTIPAASLDVVTTNNGASPSKILMEISAMNLFMGEPFRVRLIAPPDAANRFQFFHDVQFNGGAVLVDRLATRMGMGPVDFNGQLRQASTYETIATPLAAGTITFSAQAFVGFNFNATDCKFLVSDNRTVFIHPLPEENELPGFTGAIGKFVADPPQISTNRIRIGEPLRLKYSFRGEGNLTRFVPPEAPSSRAWQIIAGKLADNFFILVPLTDEVTNTPTIPFSAFDPATGNYYDLTIPALPVTVIGDGLPTQVNDWNSGNTNTAPLKLSALVKFSGKTIPDLQPPQKRFGLIAVQILPLYLLFLLWRWDERKRFMEAHPEIVRKQKAKRDLRCERKRLQQAVMQNDAEKFVVHAANAMSIAVAPHFPADARAMVCGDVLSQFSVQEQNGKIGKTISKIFAAADLRFSCSKSTPPDLSALKSDVELVLKQLEEKL